MKNYIRLTKEISSEDIANGKISWSAAYKAQITEWILNPCLKLGSDNKKTDHGIAIFVLLILFFEHHAQYLKGEDSNGKAGEFFKAGFSAFRQYLINNNPSHNISRMNEEDINNLWNFSRNGLLHSMTIKAGFSIDCVNYCQNSSFSFYSPSNIWLINPWKLTEDLSRYVESYINLVESTEAIRKNFDYSFKKLVIDPMKNIISINEILKTNGES